MADVTLGEVKNMTDEEKTLSRDYSEDLDAHDSAITDYDAYEAMDMGKTYDQQSRKTGNGLTDNMTATIYLERAARVAGQLPEGETTATGKKDFGKGVFADILRTKWIYPNANSQFDFLTKMFLWQYGSSEYNLIPMHYDINVNETTGYIGPDCWVWNPRNFIPQSGFTSISDMDYAHALAYKSPRFFDDILDDDDIEEDDEEDYDKAAIRSIINQLKNKTKETDTKRDTLTYREKMKQSTRQILVATRYEAGKDGRWITFLPDFGCKVIRNIKNPHKNGRIPFVLKRCIPKIDSYYGNGDFARSMPMQFANDGLDNYYFQGIRVNLFPARAINMQSAIRHTITNDPAAIWEFNGSPDFQTVEGSTAGLGTYQAAKGMAKGAIQSIAGTTDTRSNATSASDPAFGKTPEALEQIKDRESTRDNLDRGFLERAMAELIDGFYSILPTISDEIPVDIFSKEIEEIIESGHTDLAKMFTHMEEQGHAKYRMSESGKQMQIKLKGSAFEDIYLRFELKMNSTAKQTREKQLENMWTFWERVSSLPNALGEYREATGKYPDWEFVFTETGKMMDLPFLAKMFKQGPTPPPAGPAGATTPATPGATGATATAQPPVDPSQAEQPPQAPVELPPADTPPVAPPATMPAGMGPAQPPTQAPPQLDPQMVARLQTVSPQNPVEIKGHTFTDPELAIQAYEMLLTTGVGV